MRVPDPEDSLWSPLMHPVDVSLCLQPSVSTHRNQICTGLWVKSLIKVPGSNKKSLIKKSLIKVSGSLVHTCPASPPNHIYILTSSLLLLPVDASVSFQQLLAPDTDLGLGPALMAQMLPGSVLEDRAGPLSRPGLQGV